MSALYLHQVPILSPEEKSNKVRTCEKGAKLWEIQGKKEDRARKKNQRVGTDLKY